MNLLYVLTGIALMLLVAASGCTQAEVSEAEQAKAACIAACLEAKEAGQELSHGPCLSDEIIPDWVCDVAHSPRQEIDNVVGNQCPGWGKTAKHFVEVDPDCSFIRAI
ncbi:MAG: hypothetical protein ACE5FW_01085 [Candidatus Aenigmatarchaeota archaeon]